MQQLQTLHLSNNQLSFLPTCQTKFHLSLKVIDASFNCIVDLPPSISNMTALRNLNLSHNKLLRLTSSIGALVELEILDLRYNGLTALPPSIGRLETLDVARNELSQMTHGLSQCRRLRVLDISSKKLHSLPVTLSALMGTLENLRLSDNALEDIPYELISDPTKLNAASLFGYLSD